MTPSSHALYPELGAWLITLYVQLQLLALYKPIIIVFSFQSPYLVDINGKAYPIRGLVAPLSHPERVLSGL